MYPHGFIGNCQISALISKSASIEWLCLPRPDSEPIFGKLLDPDGGEFSILPAESKYSSNQYYLDNTNILVTEFSNSAGDRFQITDFCPRFEQFGRIFRPMSIFRIIEPLSGAPTLTVRCKPISGWNKETVKPVRGNSHLRFDIRDESLRLTTNMPLTYLCEESAFLLKERIYMGLTWSTSIEEDLPQVADRFFKQTIDYWRTWVKHCSIPSLFQNETIRSALALKLHCYEDTGAILAALTTSLPEEVGHTRNWDYRFCWLRDAHFVLTAFHNLGHFEEMEGFLKYLLGIAQKQESSRERLAPVYSLSQALPVPETEHPNWVGFQNSIPVRTLNQAAEHIQNDVYGEMVLTLAPIYLDRRFFHLRDRDHEDLLAHLVKLCERSISQADAGLWEVRAGWQEHSFTNLLCWAGLERASRIQANGYLKQISTDIGKSMERAYQAIVSATTENSIRNGPTDATVDASLALASVLRFPNADINLATIRKIQEVLALKTEHSNFFYRYLRSDDFGKPTSAFVICSFWVAQGLSRLGFKEEAIQILQNTMPAANHLGLFAEHYQPKTKTQLGNFPQAYSHVGLINAAFAVSPPWNEIL